MNSENPVGTTKQVSILVTKKEYEAMRYEDGNTAKHRQCQRVFRQKPDLAWFEDDAKK